MKLLSTGMIRTMLSWHRPGKAALIISAVLCGVGLQGCDGNNGDSNANLSAKEKVGSVGETHPAEAEIIQSFLARGLRPDGLERIHVVMAEEGVTRNVAITIHRRNEEDGSQLLLLHVNSPPEERDRSALVSIGQDGTIAATRYAQSSDSFVVATSPASEDSLFGMTLQELAGGQPEKYQLKLRTEVMKNSPAYRLEGELKEGIDSRFHRIVLEIAKETYEILFAEFFNGKGELIRRMSVDESRAVDGHPTRIRWTVDNVPRRMRVTFTVSEVVYTRVERSLFTREHLKRIASR